MNTSKKTCVNIGICVLSTMLLGGCGYNMSADGMSTTTIGFVHTKDRKETTNFGVGKGAWSQGVSGSHNPWAADEALANNTNGSNASPAVRR